jgi:hypothetical protein
LMIGLALQHPPVNGERRYSDPSLIKLVCGAKP